MKLLITPLCEWALTIFHQAKLNIQDPSVDRHPRPPPPPAGSDIVTDPMFNQIFLPLIRNQPPFEFLMAVDAEKDKPMRIIFFHCPKLA